MCIMNIYKSQPRRAVITDGGMIRFGINGFFSTDNNGHISTLDKIGRVRKATELEIEENGLAPKEEVVTNKDKKKD